MSHIRFLAAGVIDKVTQGHSLTDSLTCMASSLNAPRDKAFLQALCYGVCRYYSRLDWLLSELLKKPMREKEADVHALLLVGLYQLMAMRIPPYAAVTETVNAVQALKKPWARGLINAVLREYLRRQIDLEKKMMTDSEAAYAHPIWWMRMIEKAWPGEWQTILEANNVLPPLTLRVNQTHLTRAAYVDLLQSKGYDAVIIPETQSGLVLTTPLPIEEVPGFMEGHVSVQDGAAQLAAELLEVEPGQRVLDACAAPGGKLTHILEIQPKLILIAVEKESKRLPSIQENLTRLKMHATCLCHDVSDIHSWWDGQLFDRILLDAPCSASGVIRRHPDIKLLRQPKDIVSLAEQQLHLLKQLWPLLAPQGLLLYATCSIFPQENGDVLQKFMAQQPDAKEEKITATWGVACQVGRQILTGMHQMDGFYYAKLRKRIGEDAYAYRK